ncbi:jerky-like protein [Lasius niger]|uniref:Jerky-like protein n=1 Tax=Lasius niger TaxID=67767 RepID=A0A0J7JVI3_LASNI|nr:jerky-like protein [Lasius niger]
MSVEENNQGTAAGAGRRSFSGLGFVSTFSGGPNIKNFLQEFKDAAKLDKWTDEEMVFALPLRLREEAATFFRENVRNRDLSKFEEIEKALLDRFQPREQPTENLRKLIHSIQLPTESVRAFASRIEALSYKNGSGVAKG